MKRFFLATILIASAGAGQALTLDALLQKVVENNPAVQGAKAGFEQAGGRRLVLHAIALPNVRIGIAGGVQGGQRAGEKPIQPFAFAYLNSSQAFFNLAIPPTWRRGDVEVLIAEQRLNVAMVEQLRAARIAFYTALYNRDLTRLRQQQRTRLQENAASQEARYQAGLVNRGAWVGAQIQTRDLDPQVNAAQRAYQEALLKMSEAMGENSSVSPEGALPEGEPAFANSRELALQRPDLQLARLLIRAAADDQRIIEAAYFPVINLTVSGDYIPVSDVRREQGSGSPHRSDDIISSELRAGAAYSWRVIDNGKVTGAVRKQRAAREVNELLLQKMERDTPLELERLENDFGAIAAAEKNLRAASTTAEQNAAAFAKNLETGLSSQLEYRLAENDSLEVQAGLLGLAYQRSLALAEWDRATGRYLRFVSSDAREMK